MHHEILAYLFTSSLENHQILFQHMTGDQNHYTGDNVQSRELFFRNVVCPQTEFVVVAVRAGLGAPPQTDDFCCVGFIDPCSAAPLCGSPYTFNMTPRRWRQTTRR
jgi:hypothetical protein